jgi:hypothetical protein
MAMTVWILERSWPKDYRHLAQTYYIKEVLEERTDVHGEKTWQLVKLWKIPVRKPR